MKLFTAACLLLLSSPTTFGLYKDEAGLNDFLLSSAGHGYHGVNYAQIVDDYTVITSSVSSNPNDILGGGGSGCHVAGRDINTGSLQWRRNVCTSEEDDDSLHSVYTSKSSGIIYTNDKENIVKGWNGTDGSFLFDYASSASTDALSFPRIWGTEDAVTKTTSVLSTSMHNQKKGGDIIRFYHPTTGQPLSFFTDDDQEVYYLNTNDLLQKAFSENVDKSSFMLGLVTLDTNQIGVLVGYASSSNDGDSSLTSFSQMALVQLSFQSKTNLKIDSFSPINNGSGDANTMILTSSLQSQVLSANQLSLVAISSDKKAIVLSSGQKWNVDTALIDSIPFINSNYIQVSSVGGVQTLLSYNNNEVKEVLADSAIGFCPEYNWLVTSSSIYSVNPQTAVATKVKGGDDMGKIDIDSNDSVKDVFILSCSDSDVKAMITTFGGTTQTVSISKGTENVEILSMWSAEEALGSITSTIMLDESHPPAGASSKDSATTDDDIEDEDEEIALQSLSFSSRIQSQIKSLQKFALSGGFLQSSFVTSLFSSSPKKKERDYAFGFAKVAVLLSEPLSKIIAIDTANSGKQIWSMGLNRDAEWHKILHGGPNGKTLMDVTVGAHSHEVLVLSYVPSDDEAVAGNIEWKCMDGTRGKTYTSSTSTSVSSPVAQIIPLHSPASVGHVHDSGGCRQMALLLHEDDTLTVVPDTAYSRSAALNAMNKSNGGKNGMYVHTVDKSMGKFRTVNVLPEEGGGSSSVIARATTVGETTFNPSTEKIVNVVYPQRGEVIQSPASILGDDSLLLKYLNPHLAVVVTVATDELMTDVGNNFYKALGGDAGEVKKPKKKPLGVTKPGEEASAAAVEATPPPTLFINLMDTVSGQILYRASHAHRDTGSSSPGSSNNIPVVFTENWIIYAFANARTRRTDIGVLSLHEGMIDKHGITAFASPEQEMLFSSFESAKPIVLSKTYGISKTVTAIGVTTSKGGISMKQVLLATNGDQIISLDKRFLDPRRPSGELKESEKKEGLMKYSPILPIVSLRTPSYTQTVESVRSIASTAAYVESQSLILAYGGPDIFFTRLAPSKGFDLLPDDFNRSLLALVVIGLLIVMNTVKKMGNKKMVKMGWT